MKPSRDISSLIAIMASLRTPDTGCPWDIDQDFRSIASYTIEEAYEVTDAIERGNMVDLQEELGDLLLQVVFHARMAEELNLFDFGDVVEGITRKIIRRHPHVFGNIQNLTSEQVNVLWDNIKSEEKREKTEATKELNISDERVRVLDGVPANMPALMRADKLTSKAAKVGFDWSSTQEVVAKIKEELAEVENELLSGNKARIEEEIGDLLFAVTNLARRNRIDSENALRGTNAKFERRFAFIERVLEEQGRSVEEASLQEMDALWNQAKITENL